MNALLLTFGLLMQAPVTGANCGCPNTVNGCHSDCCQNVCSPCYGSSCWGCKTVCGSHSISHCGCIKPIGDLHQHYPYSTNPRTYYYFRPYNHQHVRENAAQAEGLGAHPKAPYSNALFQDAYQVVEAQFAPAKTQ